MPTNTVSTESSSHVWRYKYPRWWGIGIVLLAVFCLAHLLLSLYVTSMLSSVNADREHKAPGAVLSVSSMGEPIPRPINRRSLMAALLPGEIASFTVFIFAIVLWRRTAMRAANSCVRIVDTGLEYNDGLGKVRIFPWDEIEQVSIIRAAGLTQPPELFLHYNGGRMRFPSFLERTDEIAGAVAERAGLSPLPATWYQQRFTR